MLPRCKVSPGVPSLSQWLLDLGTQKRRSGSKIMDGTARTFELHRWNTDRLIRTWFSSIIVDYGTIFTHWMFSVRSLNTALIARDGMETPSTISVFAVHESKILWVFPTSILKSQEMCRHTKHSERSVLDDGQKIYCSRKWFNTWTTWVLESRL